MVAVTWPWKFVTATADKEENKRRMAAAVMMLPLVVARAEGLLEITVETSKKFFITFTSVKALATGELPAVGMDGEVLAAVKREGDINRAVRHLIKSDRSDPWGEVCSRAVMQGVASGVYAEEDAHRGLVAAAVKGKTEIKPVPERVAALEVEADRLAVAWNELTTSQPALFKALWEAIASGIKAQEKRDDND
ncbi:MAG: hypothetical protein ACYDGR_13735 [Candidatus Dormibacteria bacterium]